MSGQPSGVHHQAKFEKCHCEFDSGQENSSVSLIMTMTMTQYEDCHSQPKVTFLCRINI